MDLSLGRGAPGRAQPYVDGVLVAQEMLPVTDYESPFRFTGTLHTVTVDLSGELITDSETEMRLAMARQHGACVARARELGHRQRSALTLHPAA